MRARFFTVKPPHKTKNREDYEISGLEVRREAQREKAPRLVLRVQGILMSLDGHTTGDIAHQLKVHRSTVPLWIEALEKWSRAFLNAKR